MEAPHSDVIPTHGNTRTMNLENILFTNIDNSDYMRKQMETLSTIREVVDTIENDVHYLSPYIQHKSNAPSTAFCALLRIFRLHPTYKDAKIMQRHSNKYVRGIFALFVRYCVQFDLILGYLQEMFEDHSVISITLHGEKKLTLGQLVKNLIYDQKFCDSLLPRIPQQHLEPMQKLLNSSSKKNNRKEIDKDDEIVSFSSLKKMSYGRDDGNHYRRRSSSRRRDRRSRSSSRERHRHHHYDRRHDRRYDRSRDRSNERRY
ncbi:Pre-mRNA-splicing factor 38 [Entamoeba marina]